jgi:hypothetical protein
MHFAHIGAVALAEGGILKRDFRKRTEEKCDDTSV